MPGSVTLLKIGLHYRCFPVDFTNCFRTAILKRIFYNNSLENHLKRLWHGYIFRKYSNNINISTINITSDKRLDSSCLESSEDIRKNLMIRYQHLIPCVSHWDVYERSKACDINVIFKPIVIISLLLLLLLFFLNKVKA